MEAARDSEMTKSATVHEKVHCFQNAKFKKSFVLLWPRLLVAAREARRPPKTDVCEAARFARRLLKSAPPVPPCIKKLGFEARLRNWKLRVQISYKKFLM